MEKTKTNKKSKSSVIVLLVAILLCVAVVLGIGGFTYAKYISEQSVDSKTANVAKWGYKISVDADELFGDAYGTTTGAIIDYSTTGATVGVKAGSESSPLVAPGTTGSMTFSITGKAEVRSKITITADEDNNVPISLKNVTDGVDYEPIKWTLSSKSSSDSDYTDVTDCVGVSLSTIVSTLNGLDDDLTAIETGTEANMYYKLSWEWAFEDTTETNANLYDTILGEAANDRSSVPGGYTAVTEMKIALTITVEQIQGADS